MVRGEAMARGGEGDPEGDSEGGSGGVRNLPISSPDESPANTRQADTACRARGGGGDVFAPVFAPRLCAMISGPVAAAQTPPIASARPRIRLRAARRPGVSAAQGVCSVGSQQGDSEPGTTDGFLV